MTIKAMAADGVFVVGDVHGCLHTLAEVLKHWNHEREMLVQLGDLVVGGLWSPEVVALARQLERQYSGRTVFLLGNHEQSAIEYFEQQQPTEWFRRGGSAVIAAYAKRGYSLAGDIEWFRARPVFWENNAVVISHAGIGLTEDPYNPHNRQGVVWYRGPLQNIGKLQIVGHVPVDEPSYSRVEHCWRIDTGARSRKKLSALRLALDGTVTETITVPVVPNDFAAAPSQVK